MERKKYSCRSSRTNDRLSIRDWLTCRPAISSIGIEKLLLNTETVNRFQRYWNFLLDFDIVSLLFSIERASSSFSFQLATVKLYVENQIILNVNNFDSFSDQQLSCDPLFGTERRTTACARPRILIGQRNCQLSQKLGPSPDNEGLNIKNCILAARTLNVPLFYGDT